MLANSLTNAASQSFLLGGLELQADGVDAMALISRGLKSFALKHVAQVTTARLAHDLNALHAVRVVFVCNQGTLKSLVICL